MKLVRFTLDNSLFVNLIAVLILIVGLFGLKNLKREAFPLVDFDVVLVQTVYPGASPSEVERFVSDPLEEQLKNVSDIKKLSSTSIESLSVVVLEIDPDAKDKEKVVEDIKTAVDQVKDLPDEVEDKPQVRELATRDQPVVEVALTGLPYDQLRRIADDLETRFLDLPDCSTVAKHGYRDKEIVVRVRPDRMRHEVLSIGQLAKVIDDNNRNMPAGALKTHKEEYLVRTVGEVQTSREVADIVIRANDLGETVTIGDVANVSEEYAERKYEYRTNGKDSINLVVVKQESGDIIRLVDDVRAVVAKYKKERDLPELHISYINDFSYYVKRRLNVLRNNAGFGGVLVLLCLVLFLSPGISLMTSLGLPIAFAGALAGMMFFGATINLISMMGLIIVLGMLVDDAIIVSENVFHYAQRGVPPKEAVIRGTSEVIKPVAATILTTMAAFSPLMMMGGILGKFIFVMPLTVIIALSMSWFESMVILPAHLYDVLKWGEKWRARRGKTLAVHTIENAEQAVIKERRSGKIVRQMYGSQMRIILRLRYLVLLFAIGVTGFSFWWAKNKMSIVMFPSNGVEVFIIKAKLPTGTEMATTSRLLGKLEPLIMELPSTELKDFTTLVGKIQNDPNDPFKSRGSNLGQIAVYLTPAQSRKRKAKEIIAELEKKIKPFRNQFESLEISRMRGGPPQGKPVSIAVKGDDFGPMLAAAKEIENRLKKIKGVISPANDFVEGKRELVVRVNRRKAARAAVAPELVPVQVRGVFEGLIASRIKRGDEELDIRVIYPDSIRNRRTSFRHIVIPNRFGRLIPLTDIATVTEQPGIGVINHLDTKRVIRVNADLDDKVISSLQIGEIAKKWVGELETKYPGILVDISGGYEDTKESMQDLQQAFMVALFLIFMILATLFKKLALPFVILTTIPFGLVGVIWAFYIHGLQLSFLGMLGAIGLSGVVVNDAIVLVDYIERHRPKGLRGLLPAVIDGGARRILPVWLTSVTTVVGLLPVAYGWGGFDPFVMPIAIAIGWGLVLATLVTLVLVPTFYAIRYTFLMDVYKVMSWPVRKIRKSEWKAPDYWAPDELDADA